MENIWVAGGKMELQGTEEPAQQPVPRLPVNMGRQASLSQSICLSVFASPSFIAALKYPNPMVIVC
jgi:hypothetical protein